MPRPLKLGICAWYPYNNINYHPKILIKSQRRIMFGSNFYGSDVISYLNHSQMAEICAKSWAVHLLDAWFQCLDQHWLWHNDDIVFVCELEHPRYQFWNRYFVNSHYLGMNYYVNFFGGYTYVCSNRFQWKCIFGNQNNWKSLNPGGRFAATSY